MQGPSRLGRKVRLMEARAVFRSSDQLGAASLLTQAKRSNMCSGEWWMEILFFSCTTATEAGRVKWLRVK